MRIIGYVIAYLLILFSFTIYAQYPDIIWTYDLDAPSYGGSATADIDDDGHLEIIFGTYFNDESIYALNAEDGSCLWSYYTGGCNDASSAIADVDLDDDLEVIAPASSPSMVYCFSGADGTVEWSSPTASCIDSPPAVADVDNDGKPEVILGTFLGHVYAFNGEDGSECWHINLGYDSYIQSGPNILSINGDEYPDVVVAQFRGDSMVYALNGYDGSTIWYSDLPTDWMYHGCSYADIDEDGQNELVIGCYDNKVYCLNREDGSLCWSYTTPNYILGPTSIADLNDDDHLEIVYPSHNRIGVLSYEGDFLWDYTVGDLIWRGASIADIDGDGILDVVFGSDDGGIYALSGDNGDEVWTYDLEAHYGDEFWVDHGPAIADFDEDGKLDVFFVGGYGVSDPEDDNYGRAYALTAGEGNGDGWEMFRHDLYHSACFHGYGTDIVLVSFSSKSKDDVIILNWSVSATEGENIAGFNLFRREMGLNDITNPLSEGEDSYPHMDKTHEEGWSQINSSLITGENPYSYIDATVDRGITYEYRLEAVVEDEHTTLGTTIGTSGVPTSFTISSIHPNPVTDRVNITLSTPERTDVNIDIYDIKGRVVKSSNIGEIDMGEHTEVLSTGDLSSGVYTVKATAGDETATDTVVVVK